MAESSINSFSCNSLSPLRPTSGASVPQVEIVSQLIGDKLPHSFPPREVFVQSENRDSRKAGAATCASVCASVPAGGALVHCQGRLSSAAPISTVAATAQVFHSFHHIGFGFGLGSGFDCLFDIWPKRGRVPSSGCSSLAAMDSSFQTRYSRRHAAHVFRCSRASGISSGLASARSRSPHSNLMC